MFLLPKKGKNDFQRSDLGIPALNQKQNAHINSNKTITDGPYDNSVTNLLSE